MPLGGWEWEAIPTKFLVSTIIILLQYWKSRGENTLSSVDLDTPAWRV